MPHRGLNPCNSEKEFARLLVVVLRGEYCARGDSIANMAGDKREGRGIVEEEEVVEVLVAIFALATDEKSSPPILCTSMPRQEEVRLWGALKITNSNCVRCKEKEKYL